MGLSKKRPITPSAEIKRLSSKEEEKNATIYKQVLKKIRTFTVRERLVSFEFEKLPDPKLHPLYRELIKNPISLSCMEKRIAKGTYSSPEEFAQDFLEMCKNAKTYNRAGTTIYKDANRMYSTFIGFMKESFPNLSEMEGCDSDEDEEHAWARDLRERSSLAWQERNEYQEAQRKYARQRAIYFSRKENIALEKEKKHLLDTELLVRASTGSNLEGEDGSKKQKLHECGFCDFLKKAAASTNNHVATTIAFNSGVHTPAPTTPANRKAQPTANKQVVITPSFRLIHSNSTLNKNSPRKHPVTGPKKFKI